MTQENTPMADQLIAADQLEAGPNGTAMDPEFALLLETEKAFEERVARIAKVTWAVAFVCLVCFAVLFGIITDGAGSVVEIARVLVIVVIFTGAVSFLAATLTSISWLFRSRTPTLRAIERRLAALEKLLMNR